MENRREYPYRCNVSENSVLSKILRNIATTIPYKVRRKKTAMLTVSQHSAQIESVAYPGILLGGEFKKFS